MEDVSVLRCLSISNRSLLDETNAISMPEKKAENNNEIMIMTIVELILITDFQMLKQNQVLLL